MPTKLLLRLLEHLTSWASEARVVGECYVPYREPTENGITPWVWANNEQQ